MPGFVIEYHRRSGVRKVQEFLGERGASEALQRRLELERERADPDIEIVSLNGASLEQVMLSHSRYFQGSDVPLAS